MSRVGICLLKHMGKGSPIGAYRSEMAGDVAERVANGETADAAWLAVIDDKLAELSAEQARIEQVVADAYAKAPKADNRVQNGQQETQDANALQTGRLPGADRAPDLFDAAAGDGNRQQVDAGLAGPGERADQGGAVPAGPDSAGGSRAGSVQQRDGEAPGSPRDRAGARPESGTADDFSLVGEDIGKGGLTKKYRDNIAALKIIKALDAEGRKSTADERKVLARWVGWGALKGVFDPQNRQWSKEHAELKALLTDAEWRAAMASTRNAHFTSPVVVTTIFNALDRLGVTRGRMLEPSVGSGNFFGLMPAKMRNASSLYGVELDPITSKIAAGLYPSAQVKNGGFEDFDVPAEFFDFAAGNPPFGEEPLVDMDRSPYSGWSIHNYFFGKTIDKLRPGGVMAMVVSHNFLDRQDASARKWIADRASLIGAVRLPRTAFKENAGTEVVTDILIFQKHDRNGLPADDRAWVEVGKQTNTDPKTGEDHQHSVSGYFLAHPEHVLGTPSAAGTMYRAGEYTVEPNGDLKEQLQAWAQTLPEGVFQPIDRTEKMEAESIPDGVKVGSFYVAADGSVKTRGDDVMGNRTGTVWTPPNDKAAARMKGMIGLRDALRAQMRLERSADATSDAIEAGRAKLNTLYDDFRKAHGFLNDPTNRRLFLDDTEASLVLALEFDYDKGVSAAVAEREGIEQRKPSANKADIFSRRVLFPPQDGQTAGSARDALLASLNYKGTVDLPYMERLYGKDTQAIVKELGDLVFTTPDGKVVTADEYLSGDVKTKLADAEAAARTDAAMKRNVEALRKVIPADKKPSEIHAAMGAKFIPGNVLEEYAQRVMGGKVTAHYVKSLGQWLIDSDGTQDRVLNTSQWGTGRMPALEIIRNTIAGKSVVVTDTHRNADGSTTTVVNEKETEAAREKQRAMKEDWQSWLWGNPERADNLVRIYNEEMNRLVERSYDGSHLTLPGKVPDAVIELLPHQKAGVWRALQSRQILLDHVVGAGKTFQMVAIAMELRRMGIARKPFFAVPNHLTLQWRSEFARMYPAANVLAATPEDFAKGNREKFFAKIITGDWDAVIVGHSSLKKIALPPETEKAILQEQVDELSSAIEEMKRGRGDRNIVRDMEGIKRRLEAKMKDKLAALGKRDKVVTFDELGVDAMFVDELHEFKNLFYNSTMDRVPGMGNPTGSDKAFDLFVKVQWLNELLGDQAPIIGATGTPVSNSLVEMFNMQRFMQYPTLKREGLNVFDAWARQFGSVENVYEVSPSGTGYRSSNRFSKFKNLPALMGHYNTFADVVTLDDLKAQEEARGKKFPVPKIRGGRPAIVVAERSPEVANFMGVPQLELLNDTTPLFSFNPGQGETAEVREKEGKFQAVVLVPQDKGTPPMERNLGTYATDAEARMAVVEAALSPKITVDPASILGQFANLKQLMKESKGKVNALSLTGAANKAGLDYRLINPAAPDFAGSKINLAIDNMMDEYARWKDDRGTQLIFCDLSVPLSERGNLANKAKRLYVREDGEIVHKKGTMHTVEGFEAMPFFVVQRGAGETKAFDLYDAASGLLVKAGNTSKVAAVNFATEAIKDPEKRQRWLDAREQTGEITQDLIDAYNDANEIDTEESEAITLQDIAGVSAATGFSVYDDIKAKLIKRGVPESEIAFIHDYSTPTAKDKLFKAVNRGDIRFLLGSTPKMGAGTNVQQRLVALHHIDAPWRPSDLEQREGRIIRRGNKLYDRDPEGFEIGLYRYATRQTYDTRRWQILEHKARGIEQLRNYDGTTNEIDDIDGEAANAADMKAAASGDPLILKETQLRNDVRRLENLQAAHQDSATELARKSRYATDYARIGGPAERAQYQDLIDKAARHPVPEEGLPTATDVDGQAFKDRKEFTQAIARMAAEMANAGSPMSKEIRYRGLKFGMSTLGQGGVRLFEDNGNFSSTLSLWAPGEAISATGIVQRLGNFIDRLGDHVAEVDAKIQKAKDDAPRWMEESKKPFAQAQDLTTARAEHKKVRRLLIARGPEVPAKQKPMLDRAQKRQQDALREQGFGPTLDELMSFKGGQEDFTPKLSIDATGPAAQTPNHGTPNADDRRAVELLQAGLRKQRPDLVLDAVPAGSGTPGGQLSGRDDRARQAAADVAARLFGKQLTFFTSNVPLAAGAYSTSQPDRLFLSRDNAHPIMAVTGHELLHAMRRDRPDLYATLRDAIRANSADVDQAGLLLRLKYKKLGLTAPTEDAQEEEFLADVVGDRWTEPEFWSLMSQGQPQGMRKVLAAIVSWLDALVDKIRNTRPFNTAVYLTDIKAAREAVADALRNYSAGEVGTVPDNGEVRFSLAEPTDTPAFRRWFGDSKVVDAQGKPLVVYHGTQADFATFKNGLNKVPSERGIFFSPDPAVASAYAGVDPEGNFNAPEIGSVMPVFLSMQNPLVVDFKGERLGRVDAIKRAREGGHDGAILKNHYDAGGVQDQYVVFRPEQIKSATGNAGTYDPKNPDIRFSRGAGKGITVDEAKTVAATVRAMFPSAPPIIVHNSVSEVRPEVQDMIRAAGAFNDVEAMFHEGEIHVFASHLKDVERALFVIGRHEIRHAGMAAMFGSKPAKRQALLGIAMKNRDLMDAAVARVKAGQETDRITAIEEVLADMPVSRLMALDGIDRLVAKVRQWLRAAAAALRKKGYAALADAVDPKEWTDKDVAAFVLRAENISRGGGGMRPASGGTMFSEAPNTTPWYSALARAVKGAAMNAAPASAWKAAIKNWTTTGKAKADEVTWSGLDEWLDMQQGKVTKQAVQQFLDANGVRVQETVLGGDAQRFNEALDRIRADGFEVESDDYFGVNLLRDGQEVDRESLTAQQQADLETLEEGNEAEAPLETGGAKYSNYTLPGGTNYREVLLTLPPSAKRMSADEKLARVNGFKRAMREKYGDGWLNKATPDELETNRLLSMDMAADAVAAPDYRSNHWDQPNVLAHIRVNDRTDADGKRVLFVEEIQSDWGQAGKKQGFGQTMRWTVMDKRGPGNGYQRGDFATEAEALAYIDKNNLGLTRSNAEPREVAVEGVPAAPFVGKTDAWVSLALKRVVKMAVDGGYDRVAFVTGEQSAERYDLSKQISKVTWFPEGRGGKLIANGTDGRNVMSQDLDDAAKLEDYIGKDVAKRLLESKAKYDAATGEQWHELSGLDLKMGGEGMKAFYDKIVPAVAKDVLRKMGGQLGTVQIGTESKYERGFPSIRAAEDWAESNLGDHDFSIRGLSQSEGTYAVFDEYDKKLIRGDATMPQPGFDITDAMKAHAAQGMPMFSRAQQDKQERAAEKTLATEKDNLAKALTGLKGIRGARLPAGYVLNDFMGKSAGTMHWWHKTVGTPYNVALRNPQFKPVFDAIQNFLGDVSHYAAESANKAPTILPKLETLGDVLPEIHVFGKTIGKSAVNPEDAKSAAAPIFEGTLDWGRDEDGKPVRIEELERRAEAMSAEDKAEIMLSRRTLDPRVLRMWRGLPLEQFEAVINGRYRNEHLKPGVVWSDAELRSQFNLTPQQIALYREFRSATDQALEDLALSSMIRVAGKEGEDLREKALALNMNDAAELLRDRMFDLAEQIPDEADKYNKAGNAIIDIADRVQDLQDRGYAPLSRFGGLTLDVVGPDGERLYFGMFETDRERRRKARELEAQYPEAIQTQGTVSKREWELFAGVTPETLELFADKLGISEDLQKTDLYQNWLRFAKADRSGLKRLIHRKGVPGFSQDIGRVLASFVYSTARQTSMNLHAGTAEQAIENIDRTQGQLKDYAVALNQYVKNPQEEAQALRSMLFAQYLGGSIASAMVNMTQPFMVTFPYLTQFGGAVKAEKQMVKAMKDAGRRVFADDPGLTAALRRAAEGGVVSPQEVFHLQAQASGKGQLSTGDGTALGAMGTKLGNTMSRLELAWGKPFEWAEQFNRRVTFIAAYRTAVEQGMPNPEAFATRAVEETQFVYNKGNRPQWARSSAGALLFTFKTFSISMMEVLTRAMGSPRGRRTAVAMLFMIMLMAGVDGLPFMEDMEDVIDGFAQRVLEKNWSTKAERNRLIAQALMGAMGDKWGLRAADLVAKGISGLPGAPIDVSGRLGLHNLIPGTGLFLKKDSYSKDVADLVGPAGSLAGRAFDAAGQALAGDFGKAAMTMAPVAVQNVGKAVEMAKTGYYPDTKGNMVVRTDKADAVSKAIGFQPNVVKRTQDIAYEQQRLVALAKLTEREIVDAIAQGIVKNDEAAQKAGWARLAQWNLRNPETPIKISPEQVVRRSKNMTTEKTQRILKSTPRELRPGVSEAFNREKALQE